jgi:hypothetical protein
MNIIFGILRKIDNSTLTEVQTTWGVFSSLCHCQEFPVRARPNKVLSAGASVCTICSAGSYFNTTGVATVALRPRQQFDPRPKQFDLGGFVVYKGRYDHVNLCELRLLYQQICCGRIEASEPDIQPELQICMSSVMLVLRLSAWP